MDKYKKYGIYVLCAICGIYTADMIYRIVRYICAASKGDAFQKMVMLLGSVVEDAASFMILSAVCVLLSVVSAFLFKGIFKKRTIAVHIANLISCLVLIISTSNGDAPMSTVVTIISIVAAATPVYVLTGLWCIYFCIKDLCDYFLKAEEFKQ